MDDKNDLAAFHGYDGESTTPKQKPKVDAKEEAEQGFEITTKNFRRYTLISLAIASVILPAWLISNSSGWTVLAVLFLFSPMIFVYFWLLFLLRALRPVVSSRVISKSIQEIIFIIETSSLACLYGAIFSLGIFVNNAGSTESATSSLATRLYGISAKFSSSLAEIAYIAAWIAALVCLLLFVGNLIYFVSAKKKQASPQSLPKSIADTLDQ